MITALVASLPVGAAAQSTPTPSASAVPDTDADLTFRYIDDPDVVGLGHGSYIYPIVEGDGALVALSQCPEMGGEAGCRRSILRSLDALEWDIVGERLPLPGPFYGIAWTEAGFLFVLDDWKEKRPVVSHSTDGLAWDTWPLQDVDYLDQVVAGPDGYVGLGWNRDWTAPYLSVDGRRWERDTGFTEKLSLTDAATSGDTLIAIGDDRNDDQSAVVFRDGGWEVLDLPLPPPPDGGWLSLVDVAALPDGGFAIVGAFERPNVTTGPFLLTSPDGVAWESAPVTLDLGVERLWVEPYAIAAGPGLTALVVYLSGSGAKALGLGGATAVAWSTDGDDWQLATLPLPRGAKGAEARNLLVTDTGRVVIVGETLHSRANRSAIWVASLEEGTDPEASPGPSADDDALPDPSAEATLSPKQERAQQEQELLTQAGYASCSPFRARGSFDPFEFGATAAVQCDRPASGIRQVAVFKFPDAASLDDYWSYRVDSFEKPLKRSDRACDDDESGRARWEYGWVMCYVSSSSREVKVRWTDERTSTYWLADAKHRNLARLSVWWRSDRP